MRSSNFTIKTSPYKNIFITILEVLISQLKLPHGGPCLKLNLNTDTETKKLL